MPPHNQISLHPGNGQGQIALTEQPGKDHDFRLGIQLQALSPQPHQISGGQGYVARIIYPSMGQADDVPPGHLLIGTQKKDAFMIAFAADGQVFLPSKMQIRRNTGFRPKPGNEQGPVIADISRLIIGTLVKEVALEKDESGVHCVRMTLPAKE